jgi:hypothetical protein
MKTRGFLSILSAHFLKRKYNFYIIKLFSTSCKRVEKYTGDGGQCLTCGEGRNFSPLFIVEKGKGTAPTLGRAGKNNPHR